jgi:NAD(P) transhydrogenase subunit alpha
MKVVVPKESAPGEKRVALVPETVSKMVKEGFQVFVESRGGEGAFFLDEAYKSAGAEVVADPQKLYAHADFVLRVQKPEHLEILPEGCVLMAFLQPLVDLELIKKLANRKITAFAMELIPRITRAQSMDALSSMSTIAGYKAALLAADALPKFFPMLMTAAGTITPAKVFVIGAGVAGLQAIATARRLGAVVEAFDTRPAVKEQVESLGAKFAEPSWKIEEAQAQDKGGYAKELSEEQHKKEMAFLAEKVKEADVVITTALIPGKKAPLLITEEMVKNMRPGSVIVDLAAEAGGNCALTKPNERVVVNDVAIIGYLNLPSHMAYHASQMYSRNLYALFSHLIGKEKKLMLDWEDEITAGCCVTHAGEVKHPLVKKLLEENVNVVS